MSTPKFTDYATWPTSAEAATADAMITYYLASAAWHSGRLNAVADLPRAEFIASIYGMNGSYATAQLLRKLRDVAPNEANELAQHVYEVTESGEAGEWIWEALQETGRPDADALFIGGEKSVPRGPTLIRTEVEGLREAAHELRKISTERAAEAVSAEPALKTSCMVDADWLDARAARIARGGASDG